jgi:hypothetical protein
VSGELSLEKINADRITKQEERFERALSDIRSEFRESIGGLRTDIQQIVEMASRPKNGNGSKALVPAIIGLCTLILTIVFGGLWHRMDKHESIDAHPPVLEINSEQTALIRGLRHDIVSIEERVENFKQERARINGLESDMSRISEAQDWIKNWFQKVESMAQSYYQKGMVFEKVAWLEDKQIDTDAKLQTMGAIIQSSVRGGKSDGKE